MYSDYYDDPSGTRYTEDPSGGPYNGQNSAPAFDPYADKRKAVSQWYQGYLGREGSADEINGWAMNPNFGTVQQSIADSAEAQKYKTQQTQPTGPAAPAATGYDPRNALSGIFSKYGLDPNNPGSGLGNIDYFLKRGGETGGGWTNSGNQDYWARRTEQEIRKALFGEVGDLIDTGAGGSTGSTTLTQGPKEDPALAAKRDELYNMLLGRATQGLAIDRNDPTIRMQSDAFGANAERARRNYLADLAEKSSPVANLRGEQRVTAEKLGQDTGNFEAELMGRELTSRRQEIAQALTQMQGLLTGDQQLSLQRELAALDNAIKQQQLGLQGQQVANQNDQFLRSLGLQEADRASYWDALRSGLLS